jgi:hypothetical protein
MVVALVIVAVLPDVWFSRIVFVVVKMLEAVREVVDVSVM